jgi:XTP/dITP diphosphohydrolase
MEHRKLLIVTRSKGKFPEIVSLLRGLPFECVNLNDVSDLPQEYEVEEPGTTFEGNAIIKAMTFGKKTGFLSLAEDAGLEVDALNGRPGVYSARYAPGTDADRNNELLGELQGIPEEKRTAQFRAAVAIYDPINDKIRLCEGASEGRITTEPRGINGFGYDQIFFSTQLSKTNAEMTLEEKNSVSHRGIAIRKARDILQGEFHSMRIEKKILPAYFDQIISGEKAFELRLADWECGIGDTLLLREWSPETKDYTGRETEKTVTYVLKTKDLQLFSKEEVEKYGYQIISIK